MAKIILHTPIKDEDIKNLKIGDIVYLTGHITTCRDVAHRRLIEEKRELPVDLKGGAIFHAGPIVRPIAGEKDRFEMVSIGPTTSMRMEKFEKAFIKETGIKLIVGKGGMGEGTQEACKEDTCIFCVFRLAAPLSVLSISSRSLTVSGKTWGCRKPCGPVKSIP